MDVHGRDMMHTHVMLHQKIANGLCSVLAVFLVAMLYRCVFRYWMCVVTGTIHTHVLLLHRMGSGLCSVLAMLLVAMLYTVCPLTGHDIQVLQVDQQCSAGALDEMWHSRVISWYDSTARLAPRCNGAGKC
jgi:hypothetical protein